MKVTVFGAGYVGLVTSVCLAEVGNDVVCVDINESRIQQLQAGEIPIYEPGLQDLLQNAVRHERLQFTCDTELAVMHGDLQFIAVGTPPDEDGSADMQYVLAVAQTIARHMTEYRVIINKSTVPVGTADRVHEAIRSARTGDVDFDVVSNPEFLKEGAAVNDFMKPDRIIIGSDSERATTALKQLYAPFNRSRDKLIIMDVHSAELTKYAANAMLATKISFINEISNLADRLGADIEKVRLGIGSDPRIGYQFIYPGCGYGGSCFPKDVQALVKTAESVDYQASLLDAVQLVNDRQKDILFNKIRSHFKAQLKGKTFALWGLSFKPNTDDMREAPSMRLLESLWRVGAKVKVFDPVAMNEARRIYGERDDLIYCDDMETPLTESEALIIVTEWDMFKCPDFSVIKSQLNNSVIFDGRNLYDPDHMHSIGIAYYAIGRGISKFRG